MLLSEIKSLILDYIDDDDQRTISDTKLTRHIKTAQNGVYARIIRFYPHIVEQKTTVTASSGSFALSDLPATSIISISESNCVYRQVRTGIASTSTVTLTVQYIPAVEYPEGDGYEMDFNTNDDTLEYQLAELVAIEAATLSLIRDSEFPQAMQARKQEILQLIARPYQFEHLNADNTYSEEVFNSNIYQDRFYTLINGTVQIVTL
jgi:hypothetical protein